MPVAASIVGVQDGDVLSVGDLLVVKVDFQSSLGVSYEKTCDATLSLQLSSGVITLAGFPLLAYSKLAGVEPEDLTDTSLAFSYTVKAGDSASAVKLFTGQGPALVVKQACGLIQAGSIKVPQALTPGNVQVDTARPRISSIRTSDARSNLTVGNAIDLVVSVTSPVIFAAGADKDTAASLPYIMLNSGGSARLLESQISRRPTSSLIFRYVIGSGEKTFDLDVLSTTALFVNDSLPIVHAATRVALDPTLPAPGTAGSLGDGQAIQVTTAGFKVPPQNYVSSELPAGSAGPTAVSVTYHINSIVKVDVEAQAINVDFFRVLTWTEPRMKPLGLPSSFEVPEADAAKLWNPDVAFVNVREEPTHLDKKTYIYDSSRVEVWERFTASLVGPMDLWRYPFDTQLLRFELRSLTYPTDQVSFGGEAISMIVDSPKKLGAVSSTEYYLSNYRSSSKVETGGFLKNFEVQTTKLDVTRLSSYYLLTQIIPLVLLFLCAMMSFTVSFKSDFRLGLSTTALTGTIALGFVVSNAMPQVGYMTRLSCFLLESYIYSFLALLTNLFIRGLYTRLEEVKAEKAVAVRNTKEQEIMQLLTESKADARERRAGRAAASQEASLEAGDTQPLLGEGKEVAEPKQDEYPFCFGLVILTQKNKAMWLYKLMLVNRYVGQAIAFSALFFSTLVLIF